MAGVMAAMGDLFGDAVAPMMVGLILAGVAGLIFESLTTSGVFLVAYGFGAVAHYGTTVMREWRNRP